MKRPSDEVEVLRRDLRSIKQDLRTHRNRERRLRAAAEILGEAIKKLARPDLAGKERRTV